MRSTYILTKFNCGHDNEKCNLMRKNRRNCFLHFSLHCKKFYLMRQNLFGQLCDIPGLTLNLDNEPLYELLLFGDPQYNVVNNREILEATISFIRNTKNFSNIK